DARIDAQIALSTARLNLIVHPLRVVKKKLGVADLNMERRQPIWPTKQRRCFRIVPFVRSSIATSELRQALRSAQRALPVIVAR
ncbi:MAG: hypothetical protein AAF728_04110, partial [Cyanobacteria bacterium P01_D01_bin.128]